MKTNKRSKKLTDSFWSKAVGQSTLLRIDWKSFNDEMPKSGQDIFVIVKFSDGYSPLHAEYLDGDGFKWLRFRDSSMPHVYHGSDDWKRMIAWGCLKPIIQLTKECPMCKQLQCQC